MNYAGPVIRNWNTIERLVILASGDAIRVEHVPDSLNVHPLSGIDPHEIPMQD
jgi:hypothetical protein